MNDSMSPCLRQQAHRVLPDAVQSVIRQTYVQAPKKRCHPYKTPDALCYAPECELSNILPFKKKPPEAGVASGGFSRFAGKVSATAFCCFCPLDARSRECETSPPTPQPIGLRASGIRTGSVAIPFTDKTFLFRFFL